VRTRVEAGSRLDTSISLDLLILGLTVSHVHVALSKPRVLVQHLHGLVNRKGDSLSRGWILSGDIVVDIAQPELRFCRPGYLRHCRIR